MSDEQSLKYKNKCECGKIMKLVEKDSDAGILICPNCGYKKTVYWNKK